MIDVLKIGGSLAIYPEKLKELCAQLSRLSKTHPFVIVPGGGEFADTVRTIDARFTLSSGVSHRMAILGMDQYGLLLSEFLINSLAVDSVAAVKDALVSGKLPILLPSKILFQKNKLENSWDVTSDSIALHIAHLFSAKKVILVTDVDGIFSDDPKTNSRTELIKKISINDLLTFQKRTSVDRYASKLLRGRPLDCFVVNGLFPDRVESVLAGRETVCSQIVASR